MRRRHAFPSRQFGACTYRASGPSMYRVRDLNSANGTFINNKRTFDAVFSPTDELRLGSRVLMRSQFEPLFREFMGTVCAFTIGREQANDLVVPNERVSALHGLVVVRNGRVSLVDLGSNNGIFINGERTSSAQVSRSDRVSFGSVPINLYGLLEAQGAFRGTETPLSALATSFPLPPQPFPEASIKDSVRPRRQWSLRWFMVGGAVFLVLVAVLAALFFTGHVWPYWFRPYEDPWPSAIKSSLDTLGQRPGLDTRLLESAASADRLAAQVGMLEKARPLVERIDQWRRLRLDGRLGSAAQFVGNLAGVEVPQSAYDAVVSVLDRAAPGAGRVLKRLEDLVRRGLEAEASLKNLSPVIRRTAGSVSSFHQSATRASLEELSDQAQRLDSEFESSVTVLRSLQEDSLTVLGSMELLRGALAGTARTRLGSFIGPQIDEIQAGLGRFTDPLRDLEQNMNSVTSGLEEDLRTLAAVRSNVEAARNSVALQKKRHARGIPSSRSSGRMPGDSA